MGNLAQIAKAMGHEVFGCDNKVYPPMSDELNSSGINFFQGYEEKNIVDADIYVIGNAISKENNLLQRNFTLRKSCIRSRVVVSKYTVKQKSDCSLWYTW